MELKYLLQCLKVLPATSTIIFTDINNTDLELYPYGMDYFNTSCDYSILCHTIHNLTKGLNIYIPSLCANRLIEMLESKKFRDPIDNLPVFIEDLLNKKRYIIMGLDFTDAVNNCFFYIEETE